MNFLFLEPFFGGSHKDFAEGLTAHSKHDISLVTLPARFWKWRMRGAALHFLSIIKKLDRYHGLITSDLMSLADFKALSGPACPPALVYFHENQITYPLAPGEARDMQFGFTDITTALSADRILFNSRTHHEAFFGALPAFIGQMPEYRPFWAIAAIGSKSGILHPGCHFPARMGPSTASVPSADGPPLIIWNHRWEFDKNPEAFFAALAAVAQKGIAFRLALLGENFQTIPKAFVAAADRFADRIVQYGYVRSKRAYRNWLKKGHIVVSTANQENFGIAMVEAIRFGCLPLMPNRLSYPEIIPEKFHPHCLYDGPAQLAEKLSAILTRIDRWQPLAVELSAAMARFAWENQITAFDRELTALADLHPA